jgi:hypothetical protein
MLPELRQPSTLPCFLVQGHAHEVFSPFDDIPLAAGANRRRRVFTTVPREVDVQAYYSPSQAADFREWYEFADAAGVNHFAAHVRNQGPGMRWWDATWVTPPTLEAQHKGRWRMSGRLRLYGTPSETPPALTSLRAAITVNVQAVAAVSVGRFLAAAITVDFEASA